MNLDEENFQLRFSINKWEKETEAKTKKSIINYQVDITSDISKKKWSVNRTTENFIQVIDELNAICLNLPPPPKFQLGKETPENLTKIGKDFEMYMKSILYRGDVYNSEIVRQFFELEKHFEKIEQFSPKVQYTIDRLNFEVSDMYFYEKENVLFVSCAKKSNKNFIEKASIVSKISGWLSKANEGVLMAYKISNGMIRYTKLFEVETKSEISFITLFFNGNNKLFFVGFFDATVEIYQMNSIPGKQTETTTDLLKKINTVKMHKKNYKIISIGYNPTTNFFFTAVEKDNEIQIGFIETKEVFKTIPASPAKLCGFQYDRHDINTMNKYMSLDVEGNMSVGYIDHEKGVINLLYVIKTNLLEATLFKVDYVNQMIYIGNSDGEANLFTFDKSVEKYSFSKFKLLLKKTEKKTIKELAGIEKPYEVRDMLYNSKKKELYIALATGGIQIYSHSEENAEIVIEFNKDCLNKIICNEDFTIMFCGGVERKVNVISLPKYYMSEMTRRIQQVNLAEVIKFSSDSGCSDELQRGYEKNTALMKRKTLLEEGAEFLMKKNNEDNEMPHIFK